MSPEAPTLDLLETKRRLEAWLSDHPRYNPDVTKDTPQAGLDVEEQKQGDAIVNTYMDVSRLLSAAESHRIAESLQARLITMMDAVRHIADDSAALKQAALPNADRSERRLDWTVGVHFGLADIRDLDQLHRVALEFLDIGALVTAFLGQGRVLPVPIAAGDRGQMLIHFMTRLLGAGFGMTKVAELLVDHGVDDDRKRRDRLRNYYREHRPPPIDAAAPDE